MREYSMDLYLPPLAQCVAAGCEIQIVPDWIETCLAIGETPCFGNYISVATEGAAAGRVFEFDHDGFEFSEADGLRLVKFASHMRFIDEDPMVQWWIRELRDH